jgi:hypothetical protein
MRTGNPIQSVHGLNLTVPENAKDVIKPWDQREDTTVYAESSVDDQVNLSHPTITLNTICLLLLLPQLIIHVPFNQNVRIRSIILKIGKYSIFSILTYSIYKPLFHKAEETLRHTTYASTLTMLPSSTLPMPKAPNPN